MTAQGTQQRDEKQIHLDLNVKVITPQSEVFVVFPGDEHIFYNEFLSQNAVFLDFPFLNLAAEKLSFKAPELLEKIVLSRKLRHWHLTGRDAAKEPSRTLGKYSNYKWTRNRAAYRASLIGLFGEAKAGDLVVVPGPGYWSNVLIGELIEPPNKKFSIELSSRYPNEKIPARRVRWRAQKRKGHFSEELIKRLQLPNPVVILERSLRSEIYDLAFGAYTLGELFSSRLEVGTFEFTTLDDFWTQRLLTYLSAMLATMNNANAEKFFESDFEEALKLAFDESWIAEAAININSPGSIRLYSQKIAPLFIAAILALTSLPPDHVFGAEINTINSENKFSATDKCDAKIDEAVRQAINMMGYTQWQKLCREATNVRNRTGLAGPSKAEITDKGSKK